MNEIQNIYDDPKFFENYKTLRNDADSYNYLIEQPAIFSLLPILKDKTILDIGCGFGDFARSAMEKGAKFVLGLDVSANMLKEAQELTQSPDIEFQQIAIEQFESSPSAYDIVVSSFVFSYIEDFNSLTTKIYSWLKQGGTFVFSVEHPMRTAALMERHLKTDERGNEYYPIYNYRDEATVKQNWYIENIKKYHRKLSTYINVLIESGFKIDKILEPMPTDEMALQNQKFVAHKISPPVLIVKASK